MKVVLFCGGLGTRLREYTGEIPKPMVKIGLPAHPLAPDEVLRPLRAQGLRPVPRATRPTSSSSSSSSTRSGSPTTSRLSGGGKEIEPGAQRHRGLEHHVRGHRASTPTSASGSWRYGATCRTRRCSWPTTPTALPTWTCRGCWKRSALATASASFVARAAFAELPPRRGGAGRAREVASPRSGSPTCSSTAGSSPSAARSSITCSQGDELVLAPFARLIAERKLLAYRVRSASGAWTHSRSSRNSPTSATPGRRPGSCGRVTAAAGRQDDAPAGPRAARLAAATSCSASARTADDIEIGCWRYHAPAALGAAGGARDLGRPVRQSRPGSGGASGAQQRPRGAPGSSGGPADVPGRVLPLRRRAHQGVLRATEARGEAGPGLHPLSERTAPGPPPRVRAHLQHLPRPPRARVRGHEGGR